MIKKLANKDAAVSSIHIDFSWQAVAWHPWQVTLETFLKEVVSTVLKNLVPPKAAGEISLAFVDDATSHQLNAQYRGKNKPTNVLSFGEAFSPLTSSDWNNYRVLGDVILAYETIWEEALEQRKTFQNHVTHLLIHGILHLLGYDHTTQEKAAQMEAMEISFLKEWGIPNPYDEVD